MTRQVSENKTTYIRVGKLPRAEKTESLNRWEQASDSKLLFLAKVQKAMEDSRLTVKMKSK